MLNRKRLGFKRVPILWGLLNMGIPKNIGLNPTWMIRPNHGNPSGGLNGTTMELPGNWCLRKKTNHVSLPETISWGCDLCFFLK
jgi:hypothetical protein